MVYNLYRTIKHFTDAIIVKCRIIFGNKNYDKIFIQMRQVPTIVLSE